MRPNELNRKAIKRTYGNTRNETIRSRILKYLKGCDTIALPQGKKYNAEDYWNLPEGQRAELIEGQLYDMAPPTFIHQKLISELHFTIKEYIRKKGGDCEVIPSPFAVNLTGNDRTWVEPDISVICDKGKLSDRGCEGAPDWIIEIASPSTQSVDYGIKLFKYRTAGVREYWIVNPVTRTVNVFYFQNEKQTGMFSFDDEIPVMIYPDFIIKIVDML